MQPDGSGTVAAAPTDEGVALAAKLDEGMEPVTKLDEEAEPVAKLDDAAQPPRQSWSSYLAAAATASAESHNTGWLRHLVSGSKRRTQSEGFDLDLTYITPQIIALGLPASGVEKLYRNPLSEVRAYLDSKHKSKYAMVNLCNERDYANEDFANAARVFRFPFADHHTCCMSALLAFCKRAQHFFDAKPGEHVLAVHCKAGKGRTGVMICAYLLYAGIQTDAEQALLFFRTARTTDMDAVNNPGQVRYVRDFARLLAEPSIERRASLLFGPTITLHAVTLSAAPAAFRAAAPAAEGARSGDVPIEWAHHELGESCATNVQRAQAASGEVWPSLQMPPAAAASSVVVDRGPQLSSRTLAIQSRLHSSTQLTRRRRKLLQSSMSALLQLAGAGAERLYASEVDLLSLVIRPDRPTSSRLVSLGLRPTSIAAALGCFPASATLTKPAAALPLASILPAVRSALIEVAPTPSSSSSAAAAVAAQPHAPKPSSPLAGPPSAAAAGSQASPTGSGAAAAAAPELTVSTSDVEERDQPGGAVLGTLTLDAPDSTPHVPGGAVVRLLGAKRRTVVLRPAELRGGALQIMDCHNCHIYALAPVRSAEVLGCTRCTIVVGAAASALSVAHAAHVRLYATAKAAQLANCRDTTAYLCVNSPPLLVGENRRLVLAPFATAYDGLTGHMGEAAVIQRLGRFRDELLNLTCTEEARREVQAVVQASFSEWLQRTGNARQLTDLMAQTTW